MAAKASKGSILAGAEIVGKSVPLASMQPKLGPKELDDVAAPATSR